MTVIVLEIHKMSHEPCSDIRFKLYAERQAKNGHAESAHEANKENNSPEGVSSKSSMARGRGRGLLSVRQRLEERKRQNIRK